MDQVEIKFREALSSFGIDRLVSDASCVIVGYSGGADSQTLLRLMARYLKDTGTSLVAAHVNHMIRGGDADRDEERCAEWAEEAGVAFVSKKIDVPRMAKENCAGIEETARRARYGFFEELASSIGGKALVATAHNADDNLETVIFNMMRGAGSRGMSGIPPVRDGRYVRPLLLCTSKEIRDFCAENAIPFNVDKTNSDTEYKRNYIRSEIVPLLYGLTDSPQEAVVRMTSSVRSDDERLEAEADHIMRLYREGKFGRKDAAETHDAVLSRFLRRAYSDMTGGSSLDRTHVESIIKGIRSGNGPFHADLPGNAAFESERGVFRFVRRGDENRGEPVRQTILELDGLCYKNGDRAVTLSSVLKKKLEVDGNIYNLSTYGALNFDKIKGKFVVRGRKDGDLYRFGNMTRKLKKLLSEKKIPPSQRDSVPVVCDGDGIAWVPGFPVRDDLRSTAENCVFVCCYENSSKDNNETCDF